MRRALLFGLVVAGCTGPTLSTRSLHEVDGKVVSSRPPSSAGYHAYLRARYALESDPPRLDEAKEEIAWAIRLDPRDPQLWTTRAEIYSKAGEMDKAMVALEKALALSPGYPPARQLADELTRNLVKN